MKYGLFLVIAVILLSCSVINGQNQQEPKLKSNLNNTDSSKQIIQQKSPFLAGTFSLLVPGFGLGQLYNGETNKFLTHTIISAACITTFLITARFGLLKVDPGGKSESNKASISGILMFLSAITYAGNYVISVADAIVSAVNINKKVQFKKYRSDVLDKLKFGFSHGKNKQLNFKLAFEL